MGVQNGLLGVQDGLVNRRLSHGRAVYGRTAVLVALVSLIGACVGPAVPIAGSATAPTGTVGSPPITTAGPPSSTPPPSPTAQASCAERVLTGMSLPQRIGQLFLLGLAGDRLGPAELSAIRDQHLGSVWFTAQTSIGIAGIRAIADAVQAQVSPASTADVGFFVAANQEGGVVQALQGPGFSTIPSAVLQGRRTVSTLTADARAWSEELRAAGVNLDFAPVFDVVPPGDDATNQPIGVLEREYGHDPLTAGSHAAAVVAGMTAAGVATTAKHFPGLGRVVGNTDFAAGVVDAVTTAEDPYLASFRAAVDAGVPFVMVALATYTRIDPAHLAAFSPIVIGGLLRGDLGFRGVVMSDDLGATAAVATMPPGQRALDFLLAGGDFIISKTAAATVAMAAALQARAAADPMVATRVDDAALRILEAKVAAGLVSCPG
jgi:beta-N-acetylhexosaminidase